MQITSKQGIVLDFIKKFIATHGYSPTVREIQTGLGLKSPSTVHEHLKALELKGALTMNPKKSRTIELLVENEYLNNEESFVNVPYIDDKYKFILVPKFMLNNYDIKNIYAYKDGKHTYLINASLKTGKRIDNIDGIVISEIILY